MPIGHAAAAAAAAKSCQSCLTLCDPTDSSPPGSAIPGILQARTLECVAISFSILLTKFMSFLGKKSHSSPVPIFKSGCLEVFFFFYVELYEFFILNIDPLSDISSANVFPIL